MTADEYLKDVLASQTLGDDSDEVKALQKHRADVEKLIRDNFPNTALTIRYAGSKAKGTMNKESYDLDIISYVSSGDDTAGETLEDIYTNHKSVLAKKYWVEPKGSALRLKGCDPENLGVDFHIDVVPGRFTDETQTDAYLYQSNGDKKRLKTNLDVHLDHVRDSGVIDAIRLAKLWKSATAYRFARLSWNSPSSSSWKTTKRRASRRRWSTSGRNCVTTRRISWLKTPQTPMATTFPNASTTA